MELTLGGGMRWSVVLCTAPWTPTKLTYGLVRGEIRRTSDEVNPPMPGRDQHQRYRPHLKKVFGCLGQ